MNKLSKGPSCANCGLAGVPLLACARCKLVQYCGKECQKQNWTKGEHKKFCISVEEHEP